MSLSVALSLDQLYRPQPGGIATYVRGLVGGLASLGDESPSVTGLAPRGIPREDVAALPLSLVTCPLGVRWLAEVWSHWPLGVPRESDVVHATSLAGPYGGGRSGAVHSVAIFDLLWRDEPSAGTTRGVRFHERRLHSLRRRKDVRLFLAAPGLKRRLVEDGFDPARLHEVRLGVDDGAVEPASREEVRRALEARAVIGPFTLYAGTREPRKNLERLVTAHAEASRANTKLGPLVLVGPTGWGEVDVANAVVLGTVSRALLRGLYRDASVVAYVPRAEGWGLPPVEALHEGARVVASTTTPSVNGNAEIVLVEPLDVDGIAQGLLTALAMADDERARERRRASVAPLTWRNAALDHLAGWR